jgi:hypothetical protein
MAAPGPANGPALVDHDAVDEQHEGMQRCVEARRTRGVVLRPHPPPSSMIHNKIRKDKGLDAFAHAAHFPRHSVRMHVRPEVVAAVRHRQMDDETDNAPRPAPASESPAR